MKRTIQFWQLVNSDRSALTEQFPAADFTQKMLAAKAAGRDLEATTKDEMVLRIEPYNYDPRNPFMILYKPRRTDQSHMSDHGQIKNLPFDKEQHLLEHTYFSFFPRNIVGFLFYTESPRPRRLVEYINIKFGAHFGLVPIYRKDLDDALRDLTAQYVTLSIPAVQAINLTQQTGGEWAAALSGAGRLLHDGSITLKIAVGKGGTVAERQNRSRSLIDRARELMGFDAAPLSSAKVVGKNDRGERIPIDLLLEQFIYKASIAADDDVPETDDIRDQTPFIKSRHEADKALLEAATQPLDSDEESRGLLGDFREQGIHEDTGGAGN